jgi:hypothetical protein
MCVIYPRKVVAVSDPAIAQSTVLVLCILTRKDPKLLAGFGSVYGSVTGIGFELY